MAYEVFLKLKDEEMSLEAFLELFSKRKNCRIDGQRAIYENTDTGVGFYYEYMYEENKGAPNVCSDGVYRVALCIEYCQPAFFFVEALYELYDLVQNENIVAYDPQIGGEPDGLEFDDAKLFESWKECNLDAVREYMLSLGPDMDDVPVMPYSALKQMWEWNYSIAHLREMFDGKMQIPTIQAISLGEEDLTAVVWKNGGPIAIPYVDVIVFAAQKEGDKGFGFCAVDYEDVKPLIEKYSEKTYANAYLLSYDSTPKEISDYIAGIDSDLEFMPMDMCDVLEYEIAEGALFPENPS
jgi:hypothetical protein